MTGPQSQLTGENDIPEIQERWELEEESKFSHLGTLTDSLLLYQTSRGSVLEQREWFRIEIKIILDFLGKLIDNYDEMVSEIFGVTRHKVI